MRTLTEQETKRQLELRRKLISIRTQMEELSKEFNQICVEHELGKTDLKMEKICLDLTPFVKFLFPQKKES